MWSYIRKVLVQPNYTPSWINNKIQFLLGKDSYDVNPRFEGAFIAKNWEKNIKRKVPGKINHKVGSFIKTNMDFNEKVFKPRIVKASTTNFNIEYIGIT